jgi:phosphoglycolate phosphatase-like HAD superfamily hydrolase
MEKKPTHTQIIFFDGDGTLWRPRNLKAKVAPYDVYRRRNFSDALSELVLMPDTLDVLNKLKRLDVLIVVVSTHPQEEVEANKRLAKKIEWLGLGDLITEFHATSAYKDAKGEMLLKVLAKYNLPKSSALMVGDSYNFDYISAKKAGVESLFIANDYSNIPREGVPRLDTIKQLRDILVRINKKEIGLSGC